MYGVRVPPFCSRSKMLWRGTGSILCMDIIA
jgi:hypothetical protein